jgi:PAS domain S-box-containing protein
VGAVKKHASPVHSVQECKTRKPDAAFLQQVIDAIPSPVFFKDSSGVYLGCNRAFEEFTGLERCRISGRTVFDVFPADLAGIHARRDAELREKGGTLTYETDFMDARGALCCMMVVKSTFAGAEGGDTGIVGVMLDVSEMRRAQEEMREKEEKYRSLFENVSDLLFLHDLDGNFVPDECNFSVHSDWALLVGRDIPANIRDLMPENVRHKFDDYIKRILEKKRDSGIVAVIGADGQRHYFEYSTYLVNKDGMPIGVRGFARDVTGMVQARRALERSEEMFRTILENIEDGYFEMDVSGRFTFMNPAFCRVMGKPEEEIRGKSCRVLFDRHNADALTSVLERIRATGEPVRFFQIEIRNKDQGVVSTESSISLVLDKAGRVSGFRGLMRDVTERKRLETSLKEQNAMLEEMKRNLEQSHAEVSMAYKGLKDAQAQIVQAEKLASIGQLAAGVAHEINNPMGFITSNLNTLEKYLGRIKSYLVAVREAENDLPADVGAELRRKRDACKIDLILDDIFNVVGESLEGAERVKKIVLDLKSFSRNDAPEITMADVNACIESTVNIVWNEIKYRARLHKELGDLPLIRCYPQQLNQVFMNLLMNAAQAMEGMGDITVRSRYAEGWIEVSVTDTGCGMSKENLERIFDPFFTTKERGKGTGLGLAISFDIVRRHGGQIKVESEQGRGSTFTVRLPASKDVL